VHVTVKLLLRTKALHISLQDTEARLVQLNTKNVDLHGNVLIMLRFTVRRFIAIYTCVQLSELKQLTITMNEIAHISKTAAICRCRL